VLVYKLGSAVLLAGALAFFDRETDDSD